MHPADHSHEQKLFQEHKPPQEVKLVNMEALERAVSSKSPMKPAKVVAATDQGPPRGLLEDTTSRAPLLPVSGRDGGPGGKDEAIFVDMSHAHSMDVKRRAPHAPLLPLGGGGVQQAALL
jgi:hypothetical protein